MATPKPRRTRSAAELPKTPSSRLRESSTNSSPYSSPSEAGYASLARSLAIAAAAAASANAVGGFQDYSHEIPHTQGIFEAEYPYSVGQDGTQSPWPVSAFSDYGSSRSSVIAYTPTPAGQLEDPFEFDHVTSSGQVRSSYSKNEPECGSLPQDPPPDDFAAFAAAIEMNSFSNNFVLPSFPPKRLRERRSSAFGAMSQPPPPQPQFDRRDSLQTDVLNDFGAVELQSSPEPLAAPTGAETAMQGAQLQMSQSNLAARRNRPKPTPLGNHSVSSKPFSSSCPQSATDDFPPATPMRRIKSTGGGGPNGRKARRSPSQSPDLTAILDAALRDDYSLAGTTIRPHASSSTIATMPSARRLSQLFQPQAAAPPTPVSPADSTSEELARNSQEPSKHHMDYEMSPPPTPHNSLSTESADPEPKLGDYNGNPFEFDDALTMVVPRGVYEREMEFFPYDIDLGEMMSGSSASSGLFMKEDAFPFDRCTTTA